jgi:hypothetical protein
LLLYVSRTYGTNRYCQNENYPSNSAFAGVWRCPATFSITGSRYDNYFKREQVEPMSWNTSFIAINKDFAADLERLQHELGLPLGEPVDDISWEDATSPDVPGKALGVVSGWTIICDAMMFLDLEKGEFPAEGKIWPENIEQGLKRVSKDGLVLGFILSGVSGTYAMTVHRDGAEVRCRLSQEGQEVIDTGIASAEEREIFKETGDEEERVFLLLERHGLSYADLSEANFKLYGMI